MRRLQGSRDPWEQLGLARSANREEVHIIITIITIITMIAIIAIIKVIFLFIIIISMKIITS